MMRLTKLLSLVLAAAWALQFASADDKPEPIKLGKVRDRRGGRLALADGTILAVNVLEKHEKKQGNAVLQAGNYHRVKLLDAATGKELSFIPGAYLGRFSASGKVLCVQQMFDEQAIKAGKPFGFLATLPMPQLWDISNPQKPKQLFVIDSAFQENFNGDGTRFVVAGGPEQKFGNSGKVVTGLPKTGTAKAPAIGGGFGGAPGIGGGAGMGVFGGFGGGFAPRFAEVWEVDSAKFVARYEPLPKGKAGVSNPIFSPDGKTVATIVTAPGKAGTVYKLALYDTDKKKETHLIDVGDARVHGSSSQAGQPILEALQFVPSHQSPGEGPSHLLAAVISGKDTVTLNLYNPNTGKLEDFLHREKQEADTRVSIDYTIAPDGKTLTALITRRPELRVRPQPGVGVPGGGFGIIGGQGGIGAGVPTPRQARAAGFGGAAVPAMPPAKAANGPLAQIAVPFPGAGGAPGGVPVPAFSPFGGRMFLQPPTSGSVVVYDLEKRAKKYALEVVPHTARYGTGNLLAVVVWDDKALKLKLYDIATGKEVGGVDDADFVDFTADGTRMLTRSGDANAPTLKVWSVEKAKK